MRIMPPPPANRQSTGAVHVAGYLYLYFPHYNYNLICVPAQLILDIFTLIPSNHIIHLPSQIQRRLTDLASPCVGLCRCVASWLSFLSILGFGFMTHTRNGVGELETPDNPPHLRSDAVPTLHVAIKPMQSHSMLVVLEKFLFLDLILDRNIIF